MFLSTEKETQQTTVYAGGLLWYNSDKSKLLNKIRGGVKSG